MPLPLHRLTPRLAQPDQVILAADHGCAEIELRWQLLSAQGCNRIRDEFATRRVTLGGCLGERFGEDGLERTVTRQGGRRLFDVRDEHGHRPAAREGRMARRASYRTQPSE